MVFTGWLLNRKTTDNTTLFIGVAAVANALMRLPAMLLFIIGALLGRVHLEDEVLWGVRAVQGLDLPMPFADFKTLIKMQPEFFLSEPRFYFWPLLSIGIVLLCFTLAYRRLFTIFKGHLSGKVDRWIFGLMPIAVIPPMFLLCSFLDNHVRINW